QQKSIVVTAPSGSGKSTLVKELLKKFPQLAFSISACTRAPRVGEKDGEHYYFMSAKQFEQHIAKNDFLEYEMVYPGKYYGTLKSEISRITDNGQIPLIDIDVQGALKVKKQLADQCLTIFIKAPSVEDLEKRLRHRATETEAAIQERLAKAEEELSFQNSFDKIVVNDRLEVALSEITSIVEQYLK